MEGSAGRNPRELHDPDNTPNAILSDIHDRMPVIISPENYAAWLNPMPGDRDTALEMLKPYDKAMRRYAVSTSVDQVQNDDADCAGPLELEPPLQGQLF